MRSVFICVVAASVLYTCSAIPFPPQSGKYIVKLKPHVDQLKVLDYLNNANNGLTTMVNRIKHKYRPVFFNGFAGEFTSAFLTDFQRSHAAEIEYIEEDGRMRALDKQPNPPSWGLVRSSERRLNEKTDYEYAPEAGSGVTVFVVDTGVDAQHREFGGRATMEKSFVDEEPDLHDGNGHGTHCAGTIGSVSYGVAKKVKIVGVKVLDSQGSGSLSAIIAGMDYVAHQAAAGKTVLSMSLGGGKSAAIDDAANAAVDAGVVVIVAAGNDSADACNGSPSGASKVFAVGAIDSNDNMAEFSNHGSCLKIFAPGVDITSTWKGGSTNTISGTSMACPHVAGVAALYMSMKSYSSPQDVYRDLVSNATPVNGLSHRVLYNQFGTASPNPDPNPGPTDPNPGPTDPNPGPADPTFPTDPNPDPTFPTDPNPDPTFPDPFQFGK